MIIKREKLKARIERIKPILSSPETNYGFGLAEEVDRYAKATAASVCETVTSFAFHASDFVGVNFREICIEDCLYSVSCARDILPTVLWHVNCHRGEYIVALYNDMMLPWIKLKNPHLDIGYSIFSGQVELDCRGVDNEIAIAQFLLLLVGIDLDKVGVKFNKGLRFPNGVEQKIRNHEKAVARAKQAEKAHRRKIEARRERKAKEAVWRQEHAEKFAMIQAKVHAEYEARMALWREKNKIDKRVFRRRSVNFVHIMSEIRSVFAWHQQNVSSPRIVLAGGVVASRSEVLSGEDS